MTFWGAAMFPVDQRQGLGDGDRHHYRLCGDRGLPVEHYDIQVALSLLLGAFSCTAWAVFGSSLRPLLSSRRAVRAFNIVMAL